MDKATEVRKGEELNASQIETYLRDVIPGLHGEMRVKQFPSGSSNLTYLITFGDREIVLRRPPIGTKAKSAHDMSREYKVLKALEPVFPFCPRPLVYADDPEIMECSFYTMERIKGTILRRDIPDTMGLQAKDVTRLCENLIKVLHELHSLDYNEIGLADLGKPEGYVERQVVGWSKRYRAARTPDVPDAEMVMTWLKEKMPPDSDTPCLIHNDYKFDNVVLDANDPMKIIGVLDWEMATLGDPLMDLGGTLAYWIESGDSEEKQLVRSVPTNAPGALKRNEVVSLYERLSGRDILHYDFYLCFGYFKLAVIVQQIYFRYFHGQTQDQRFKDMGIVTGILEKAAMDIIDGSRL